MFVTVSRWESGGAVVFTCTAFRDDSTTARFVCSLLDTDARSLPPLSLGNGRRRHAQHEPSAEMRPNPKRTPHRSSLTHPVVAPPSPTPASSLVHQRPHRPTTLFRRHHLQPRHAGAAVGSRASTAANHVGSVAVHPLPPTAGRCACGGTGRNRPLRRRCRVPPPQARRVACHRLCHRRCCRRCSAAVRGGRRASRPSRRRPSTAAPQRGDENNVLPPPPAAVGVAAAADSEQTATGAEMAERGGRCRCCQAHLAVAARPHERLGRWRRRELWRLPLE